VYVAHSSIASQLAASFNRKEASLSQSQTKRKAESTCSERDKTEQEWGSSDGTVFEKGNEDINTGGLIIRLMYQQQ